MNPRVSGWFICPQNTSPPGSFIFHNFFYLEWTPYWIISVQLIIVSDNVRDYVTVILKVCQWALMTPWCLLTLSIIVTCHTYVTLIIRPWPHSPPFNFWKTQKLFPLSLMWILCLCINSFWTILHPLLVPSSPPNTFEDVDYLYTSSLPLNIIVSKRAFFDYLF